MMSKVISMAVTLGLLIVVAGVGGAIYGYDKLWARVAGPADLGPVDFPGLVKGPKPNQALVCPAGLCNAADVDIRSPVYALGAAPLAERAQNLLDTMDDAQRVDEATQPTARRYVFRSALLRFPDTLTLATFDGPETGTSQIAIYSRSQIGYSDMGVNLARVRALLAGLESVQAN